MSPGFQNLYLCERPLAGDSAQGTQKSLVAEASRLARLVTFVGITEAFIEMLTKRTDRRGN